MDSLFGQTLLLAYLLGIAYLITKEIPKKKPLPEDFSRIPEESPSKFDDNLLTKALDDLGDTLVNASYEQYFVAAVISVILLWLFYSIMRDFFFNRYSILRKII